MQCTRAIMKEKEPCYNGMELNSIYLAPSIDWGHSPDQNIFQERGKPTPKYPSKKNLLEQGQKPTTNSTHMHV